MLCLSLCFTSGVPFAHAAEQYCFKVADNPTGTVAPGYPPGQVVCVEDQSVCNNLRSSLGPKNLDPAFQNANSCILQTEASTKYPNSSQTSGNPLSPLVQLAMWIGNIILTIAAWIAGMGGSILDAAIHEVVLGMGSSVGNGLGAGSALGAAVNESWTIIRDFANLMFIFGLAYVGLRTIFDYESADTRRMLAKIIIAALLINFSLLITKVVIDTTNVLAQQIYLAGANSDSAISALNLMKQTYLLDIYTGVDANILVGTTAGGTFAYYVGAALFLFIAGFVFAAGGLLLIVRYVALILIMVFSPILFAATVFPKTSKYASDLWDKLFSYSFFAPAYLLMLLISIKLMSKFEQLASGQFSQELLKGAQQVSSQTQVATTALDARSVILHFLIVIMFLIFSLIVAQRFGVKGGELAVKIGKGTRDIALRSARRVTWDPTKNVGLRWGSRQVRQFEQASGDDKTLAAWAGRSRVGKFVKRLPGVTGGLQAVGTRAVSDVQKRTAELKDLRNEQLKARLNTFITGNDSTKWMNNLDRLAIYNVFRDKDNLDELDPAQIRDYWNLLSKYKLGSLPINKARADAASLERGADGLTEIERKVRLLKTPGDITSLHKITVSTTNKNGGGFEADEDDRKAHVDEFIGALARNSNGGMIGALGRRQDNITDAFVTYVLREAGAEQTKSASAVAAYFDELAREAGESGTPDGAERAARNRSAAKYIRTSPAARLFGLEEDTGSSSQTGTNAGPGQGEPERQSTEAAEASDETGTDDVGVDDEDADDFDDES